MVRKLFTALLCVLMLAGVSSAYTDRFGNDGLGWDTAYVIMTSADMDILAQYAGNGKYYKLSADLTLTTAPKWARSDSSYSNFNGHFDGQNHTITYSNVSGMYGLFYSMQVPGSSEEPVLRNLNVRGEISSEESANASYGVGGIIRNLKSGIVENCTFTGTIRTRAELAGGIIADYDGGTIRNCTVSGTFRANETVGGIVGYAAYATAMVMENCTINSGTTISSSGSNYTYAGGLVGYIRIQDETRITGCVSNAQISEAGYKGGLIGYADNAYRYDDGQRVLRLQGITGNQYTAERAIGNLDDPINGNTRIGGGDSTGGNTNTGDNTSNTDGNNTNTNAPTGTDTTGNDTTGSDTTDTGDTTGTDTTDGSDTDSTGDEDLEPKDGTDTGTTTNNTDSNSKTNSDGDSGSSGGCSASAGTLMLLAVLALRSRKH